MQGLSASGGVPQNPQGEKHSLISQRINDLVEQAERLGCEGKVEEAQGVLKLCDQLKEERTQLHEVRGGVEVRESQG